MSCDIYNFEGGFTIRTVKYADELVLLAREEKVLQGMVDRLSEI
jgi:hypothetical protein